MIVEVAQEHIDNGTKRSCESCPIALAINDLGYYAHVNEDNIYIEGVHAINYETSEDIAEFIHNFDIGIKVEPFMFETNDLGIY